jgi:hypothetical protein
VTDRRTRRWFEALSSLRSETDVAATGSEFLFKRGKDIHGWIEGHFPSLTREEAALYSDPLLDFDIWYHPDMQDTRLRIVYEIKPQDYFIRNMDYCVAQISGYFTFTKAWGAYFILYQLMPSGDVVTQLLPAPFLYRWEQLQDIARKSDALLLEASVATA